ncbi:Protein Skeletor, isoforms D/E [Aphelenchoides besseyi]|nr:Protein Skeletor, isoforms D/E [Aphelenchoides besseyi]
MWNVVVLLSVIGLQEGCFGQDPDRYFGIPLGGVHLSQDSTSGEVYAYDEYSILINHFEHHPKQPRYCRRTKKRIACYMFVILGTSMMFGPPRPTDSGEALVEGHGVLVGLAQPLIAAPNSEVAVSRHRRQASGLFGGNIYRWPMEMDHLLMGPEDEKSVQSAAVPMSSKQFNGIHIRHLPDNVEAKNITMKANFTVTAPTTIPPSTSSTATSTHVPEAAALPVQTARMFSSSTVSPPVNTTFETTSTTTSVPTSTTSVPSTTTVTNPPSSSVKSNRKPGIVVTASVKSNGAASPRLQKLSAPVENTPKPVIMILGEKGRPSQPIELAEVEDVFGAEIDSSSEVFPQENGKLRNEEKNDENAYKLDVNYSDLVRRLENLEYPRRAPSRNSGLTKATRVQAVNAIEKFNDTTRHVQSQTETAKSTTPLFFVVDDPHRAHRDRILQQLRDSEGPSSTTTSAPLAPLDPRFALSDINEQLGIFVLSNGAKLSDYHWFGVYNHCEQKHVELVSLRGVDPPREERIMPLSGWSHNVSSYRVHILNCNTILVPGFNFNPEEDARGSAYFVAGIGQFPDNIEKQVKVIVVGERQNIPLRRYQNEDVLLRLPRTYRTFDIDFLSVYNTHEQKSYGHVIIPSLLVPPCSDD